MDKAVIKANRELDTEMKRQLNMIYPVFANIFCSRHSKKELSKKAIFRKIRPHGSGRSTDLSDYMVACEKLVAEELTHKLIKEVCVYYAESVEGVIEENRNDRL